MWEAWSRERSTDPDANWVATQARSFVKQSRSAGLPIRYVQRDRDGKYSSEFDAALRCARVTVVPSPPQSPNTQAFVERFIGSLCSECLHHFVFFGLQHLDSVAATWIDHYLIERPHQGSDIGNELLVPPPNRKKPPCAGNEETLLPRDVRCRQRLGGLLKHYECAAA